ncbi:6-carboxytetrahydropterin synthase QueD [Candidatus Peregrinibacteria bacterium]|jgi:6-pyruvoyltetrahydropterin/6-carboxytetrahydropterin synthase|nr:6-carboxytetrahydropterin synthase QueD [Candidatus Peregrinibacteria bacterium]MBT7736114.1 6-carboxytetrahydropterin synthase QueD [Candidatus Peregrinibacteria bacterium]
MPELTLHVKFDFAASHFLTDYNGKCEHLHGHNYKLVITVKGEKKNDGLVQDYTEIKKIVREHIIEKLDHKHLNNVVDNPSSEHLAIFIWEELKTHLPLLKKVALYETEQQFCEYEGE